MLGNRWMASLVQHSVRHFLLQQKCVIKQGITVLEKNRRADTCSKDG